MSDKLDDYPQDTENPAEWAAFLVRFFGKRRGIGLVSLYIVEAVKEARRAAEKSYPGQESASQPASAHPATQTPVMKSRSDN